MPVNDEWPPADAPLTQFDPAGPRVTEPIHNDPPLSPGVTVLESHRDGDEDENPQQAQEDQVPLPEFDPRYRDDFDGLLYVGRLEDKFEWLGHTFEIRTLTTDEVIEIGLLTKPYDDTIGGVKAYQAAVVASCVVRVDGRPLPMPITNDPRDTASRNRFDYVKRSWFPPVLDYVYEQYMLLEDRVRAVLAAMGKASR